ncbi:histidine ammonia-lyase [Ornithinibacillus sp. BX22]|uniref:Histidine ammonia-lyase n=2 Tax=Ornithinibacillus TaxID=484508 RepID=A0A923L3A1_9BACI|nr:MULTISPECIES: histidine ammonia-lyase [Ornithinibacillus]MBC5635560.1 histidine ammonia-lyase [Ornithinibacillus hominis]MBS3679170.1 histidine ammonia-lyase [Ornithinibacillus massiliensis]
MIVLTGKSLTLDDVGRIVFQNEQVVLCDRQREKLKQNREIVEEMLQDKKVMYGINTGFGKLSDHRISDEDLEALQLNLIHSHACGVGEPFDEKISKTMVLLRANALAQGYSGVRVELVQSLINLVNANICPVIPQQGSLGASGDLAPLSHLALVVMGEGEVFYQGKRMPSMDALQGNGLTPLILKAKEGLALINGTQAMTATGVVAYLEMEKLLHQGELTACMTMEGLRGIREALDADLHRVRGHQEQIDVAKRMRHSLQDSKLISSQGEFRVQDAYSLRCIPQVLGASWQTLHYAKEKLTTEMNAVTDNPLIFSEDWKVISGGNFHGQPIAFTMDFLKLGIAELANIAERRIERLVNPQLNDLPAFLSPNPGLESGAMIMQYSAAALVSENKTLAHPASVDSIPSSANQEDHVSMGTIAARHALAMLQNTRRVIAIELICAMQAVEYRGVEKMATSTREFYNKARKVVASIRKDRVFSTDIERLTAWLKESDASQVMNQIGEVENV